MSNEFSVEALVAMGTGLVSNKTNKVTASIEGYDGYDDEIYAAVTRSEESLKFLDTYELMENKKTSDKVKMLKKINNIYGIESYTKSLEDNNSNSNIIEKIKNFFKILFKSIRNFFKKLWIYIKRFIISVRLGFNNVMLKISPNKEKYIKKIIELTFKKMMLDVKLEFGFEAGDSESNRDVLNSYFQNNNLEYESNKNDHVVEQNIEGISDTVANSIKANVLPYIRAYKKTSTVGLENLEYLVFIHLINDPLNGSKLINDYINLITKMKGFFTELKNTMRIAVQNNKLDNLNNQVETSEAKTWLKQINDLATKYNITKSNKDIVKNVLVNFIDEIKADINYKTLFNISDKALKELTQSSNEIDRDIDSISALLNKPIDAELSSLLNTLYTSASQSTKILVEFCTKFTKGVSYALKAAKTFGKIRENIIENL